LKALSAAPLLQYKNYNTKFYSFFQYKILDKFSFYIDTLHIFRPLPIRGGCEKGTEDGQKSAQNGQNEALLSPKQAKIDDYCLPISNPDEFLCHSLHAC
jgi:hypothetical protein